MDCECQHNISLKSRTWIHRGGNVKNFYLPKNLEELIDIGRYLFEMNIDFITIGHTSNIYFKNSFNIDSIIDTKRLTSFEKYDDKTILCECGVHISKFANHCIEKGYIGYEGLINLPGTIGGAIVNNSSCYNCGIENILKSIDVLFPNGNIVNIEKKDIGYTFRNSHLKSGIIKGIVLRAYLDISHKSSSEELKKIAFNNNIDRKTSQEPPAYNLGSTVNCFYRRFNIRNIIIKLVTVFTKLVIKKRATATKIIKRLTLSLYGKRYLNKYISDKKIECFIWKDENADNYFNEYIDLINKIYKKYSVEIEIKE